MESMEQTLTELVEDGIEEHQWLSILFQICFGLAASQQHLGFIHNDLHSDNIMFNNTEEEFKYFRYEDIYFRVPTFGKDLKIIDFAKVYLKSRITFITVMYLREMEMLAVSMVILLQYSLRKIKLQF